jgi:MYXO-CTERM domain-containing protein
MGTTTSISRASASLILIHALAGTVAAAPHANRVRPAPAQPWATNPVTACKDTPKLAYNGGPLIQHVKVVDVFYSPGHPYKAQLESYYKAILQSAYFDWLVEYNAPMYTINRGTFSTSVEDNNPNPMQIQTVAPQQYLQKLLDANKVPAPDDDTMYMLYFPSNVDPTDGGGGSCISNGDYCAYHASFQTSSGQNVRYGVIPDMDAKGCSMGCGPTGFASFTDVSSHELVEAVTDPDSDAQGNPSGWYDPNTTRNNCGEIGDICATGGTGETGQVNGYTVQKEWSNKNNDCIVTDPKVVINDFSIAVAPATVNVPVGGMATATVTLTKVAGMAENATLSAVALPSGLTATFTPTMVTSSGGTAMLTIGAAASLMPGSSLSFSVQGKGSVAMPTATVSVMVEAPPDMTVVHHPDLATPDDLSQPSSGGGGNGGGGNGGGGNGGSGGSVGGNGGVGGNNGGNKASGCSCSIGGDGKAGSTSAIGALAFLVLALGRTLRRRRS